MKKTAKIILKHESNVIRYDLTGASAQDWLYLAQQYSSWGVALCPVNLLILVVRLQNLGFTITY
jgi:hypothetical protein